MRDGKWLWTIKAYRRAAVVPFVPRLVLEVSHATDAAFEIELQVIKERMKKQQLSHAEVIHHVEPFERYKVYE